MRRNPAVALSGINPMKPMTLVMPLIVGLAAKMATERAPVMLNMTTPLTKYGVQAAVAIGGGILLRKPLGATNATIWTVVSGVVILTDILNQYVFKTALSYVGDAGAIGYNYPDQVDYSGTGAFVNEDSMGAFPYEFVSPY